MNLLLTITIRYRRPVAVCCSIRGCYWIKRLHSSPDVSLDKYCSVNQTCFQLFRFLTWRFIKCSMSRCHIDLKWFIMQNFLIIFACVLKGFVNGFAFLIRMFLCPSYPCSLVLHFCQRNKISSFLGLKTNFSTIRQLLKLILKILCWCSLRVLSKFVKAIIV